MQNEDRHPEHPRHDLAIVILAGGRATRFPGKLEARFAGEPLLAHVYHHLRDFAPVMIAGRDTFSHELDTLLECPIVVDRWPDRGPLGGLLSAAHETNAGYLFAVAGDAPLVTRDVLETLLATWEPGDEAVVPEHDRGIEPLASLYDRAALLREGWDVLHGDDRSMHALIGRLRARRIAIGARFFANVNTADDLPLLQESP
ncbi:MAG TPA: molybdenum cofactor guanylyltransferase [Candidatus Acidoferrales bacterium]|nr:molybdenum cofactor guanylyltransferase [Candidatus Acidoferrales bacterium]